MTTETIGNLVVEITGDSSGLVTALNSSEQKTEGFGSKIKSAWSSIAAIAGPAVLAAGIVTATDAAIDFESQMDEVFTLVPGLSADAKEQMTSDVQEVAKEMGVIPSEVAPAIYQALSAGVPEDNVFSFIEEANKAAVGGATDLTTAVDGLTSVVNSYGSDVIDATQVSDIMFTTVKLGKTDFEDLSKYIYQVVPTASALGVSFDQVGASLAAITAQGTPTSVAATQLRQMLVELSKEGSTAAKTFSNLAGKSFRDFVASGGTVEDALTLMGDYATSTGQGINDLFSSVDAGNAALELTGKGADTFAQDLAEMQDASGATDEAFQTMDDSLSRRLEKLNAQFSVISDKVIEAFFPVLEDLVDVLNNDIAPAVEVIGEDLTALFDAIGSWWNGGDGQAVFSGVTDAWNGIVQTLQPGITALVQFVQGQAAIISAWWDENGATIVAAVEVVMGAIQAAITPVLNAIVALFEWAWPYISQIMNDNLSIVLDLVTLFAQLLTGDWSGAWQTVQDITENATDALYTLVAGGFNAVASGVEYVMNGISTFMTGIWNTIAQTVATAINVIINDINSLIEGLNSVRDAANDVTSQVGITLPSIPTIPTIDVESMEAPTLTISKLSLSSSSSASTEEGTTSASASSSSSNEGGVTIQNLNVYSPKADAETMAKATTRTLRTLGSRVAGA